MTREFIPFNQAYFKENLKLSKPCLVSFEEKKNFSRFKTKPDSFLEASGGLSPDYSPE